MNEPNHSSMRNEKTDKIAKWLGRGLLGLIFLIFLFFFIWGIGFLINGPKLNYSPLVKNFLLTPSENIDSQDGRTNLLILGKAGDGHEAPDLTDTIIFASISERENGITTISLPRDIWIPELRAKINSVYYWGKTLDDGGGLSLAKKTVGEILGEPIHYTLVVDISGFTKIIDVLEGIEVNVKEGFTDENYPIKGRENDNCDGDNEYRCRYEVVTFSAGKQLMNGEMALKYVRSRRAEGEQGTDLSRAERQQAIISAIKDRILSFQVLSSPKKIKALWEATISTIETDIPESAAAILAREILSSRSNLSSYVLGEDFLENPQPLPRYDYLYVFIPKAGNWDDVYKWVDSLINK